MVNLNQVETGVARYLDSVIAPKLPASGMYDPVKKIAFLTGATYLVKHSRKAVEDFLCRPIISAMGIMDEAGNIDLDGLAGALKENIPEVGLRVPIPLVGELVFHKPDVDEIAQYIKGV